ncbi:hypothetical protein [Parasphingorhabdus sp.]|uniref:hypothetical protein n=1 Tax=Parasphingorhabdus sp. TaxID=2709688 RepID=UPI00326504F5
MHQNNGNNVRTLLKVTTVNDQKDVIVQLQRDLEECLEIADRLRLRMPAIKISEALEQINAMASGLDQTDKIDS